MKSLKDTVVVTGIGVITPLKPFREVDEFWNSLCSGEDAIKRMSLPLLDMNRKWLMAGIDQSRFPNSISPENKLQCIAEEALCMAIKDANLKEYRNAGLSLGTVLGNVLAKEKRLIENKKQNSTCGNEGESLSHITAYLAAKHDLHGPTITISTACTSGTDAIGIAARKIMTGKTSMMFAGGVDVLSDFAILGFHVLQALTEEKVRPFDKNRSGLALGEGAAFVVLESEQHAIHRQAKIYGKVMGYASRADANHLTGPHREGRGLADAMSHAISEYNLEPQEIDYINAHGTGTVYNDLMETKAIKKVFGKAAYGIPISSTKSMLGHSFGASGAIEAICCLLSMKNKMVPPTINFREKDPECDLDYVPNVSRHHDVNTAISLSAGFGGQNAAILFGRA
ncbi:MAG: beta-ketoacyl-[acyl-carrier-protein] synthase family protein [Candidatus Brocadia sp.]|nr:beta-ketoacyl-[acyl-carrier-protein] synthase family protein [Candidatus Brocadia sp.]